MFKKGLEREIELYLPEGDKISRDLPVFYNPLMQLNRDLSVLLLNALDREDLMIALPLSGTGVRGVRIAKECKVKSIDVNDHDKDAVKIIKKNIALNKLKNIEVHNEDANQFLLSSKGFDYIDIDPFGSPNKFLDIAIRKIAREGVLAVTATDTAALCGTYKNAGRRKYWALNERGINMHEFGLRILIRKVQLIGAQYDKSLIPILSYSKDHYFRIFFQCKKGKRYVDEALRKHEFIGDLGPMWIGNLWDTTLIGKMIKLCEWPDVKKFLEIIHAESKLDVVGIISMHKLAENAKIENLIKYEIILDEIRKKKKKASRTHFNPVAIRTDMDENMLIRLVKELCD